MIYFYLDLSFDVLNAITGLNLKGDGLTSQCLHKDLHNACILCLILFKKISNILFFRFVVINSDLRDGLPAFIPSHMNAALSLVNNFWYTEIEPPTKIVLLDIYLI